MRNTNIRVLQGVRQIWRDSSRYTAESTGDTAVIALFARHVSELALLVRLYKVAPFDGPRRRTTGGGNAQGKGSFGRPGAGRMPTMA